MTEPPPVFMSEGHVEEMNRRLAESHELTDLCAQIGRPHVIEYRLSDGPDGREVVWWMSVSPDEGVRLGLGAPDDPPDLTTQSDYAAMVRSARAARSTQVLRRIVNSPTAVMPLYSKSSSRY